MMDKAISDFHTQFTYAPLIENEGALKPCSSFLVAGMGGSHLAGDLLLMHDPELPLVIHSDYGLPAGVDNNTLVIASSYSGNTEEVVDAYGAARERGLPLIAISTGGTLMSRAQADGVPFIKMPDTGIQPRSALGYSMKALACAMGKRKILEDLGRVADELDPSGIENAGKELAARLKNHVPVIYTSTRNRALGYNWKIKFNETGKIPAFYNVFPELNHNEMTGFDVKDSTCALSEVFLVIMIKSNDDHPRVQKRMEIVEKQYKERGLLVETFMLSGKSAFHALFSSLILADWAAFYTAQNYGLEAEQVPMIEEFKKMIA